MNWQPGVQRPLDPEKKGDWDKRLERAERKASGFHPGWDESLQRYAKPKSEKNKYDVNALLDFRHVERKKADLFHRTPDVNLLPVDPQDQEIPLDQLLPLRQKFLNFALGPNKANAKRALHKTLIDTLAASGWMVLKVGYENRSIPVPPDPVTGQQPIGPDGQPVKKLPVWERCFISQVGSKKLLVPDDYHDTDFDAAPWLAVKGTSSVSQAKAMGWTLPEDFTGTSTRDQSVYEYGDRLEDATDSLVEYTEIWYRAAMYDEDVVHPELYRCLILVKGAEEPAKYMDSPYQALDEMMRLTDDSMIGNPIHVGTLRSLPDSAYVPSDLAVGEQLSKEVNKFRTQQVQNRKARTPITLIDPESLEKEQIDRISNGDRVIFTKPGALARGKDQVIASVSVGSEPRDNYTAQDYVERDWELAMGTSANQSGQFAKTKRTATEVRNVQSNASARMDSEKDSVREYFIALVRKFDCILQRYATQEQVQKVLGQQGAQLWEQWRMLPGKYGYDIQPDSGVHVDAQQYRSQVLDEYNLLRKDERVNVDELLKKVARAMGYEPAKFVAPPQEKAPEPVKLALSFNGQDVVIPATGRLLLDILTESGVKLSPDTIQMLSAAHALQGGIAGTATGAGVTGASGNGHGGAANVTEPVNKHQTERTGGVQGVGIQ